MTGFPPFGVTRVEDNMNCQRTQKKLSRIFDREQQPDQRLQHHIDNCNDCRKFWEDLTHLDIAFKELVSPEAPGDLTVRIQSAIRRIKTTRPAIFRPAWAGGIAVAMAFVVGIWVGSNQEPSNGLEYETSQLAEAFTEYTPGSLWDFELTENNTQ